MSLALHAVSRLQRLWHKACYRKFFLNTSRFDYPSSFYRQSAIFLEQLESRLLLSGTVYSVNTLADVVADDGLISLREAINAANTNVAVNEAVAGSNTEMDIITFDMAALQTEADEGNPLRIILGGTQLTISDDLEIQGLGADVLIIDANGGSGVLSIYMDVTAEISGLTITGGHVDEFFCGGGISNAGTLYMANSIITNNLASGGGGIYNSRGVVTLSNSIISNNTAGGGGGVFNEFGTLTVTGSIIENNSGGSDGGGICSFGTLTVIGSTIINNTADWGGGIHYSGTLTIGNSTINSNRAGQFGGGICSGIHGGEGTLVVTGSTISYNSAVFGGGICNGIPPIAGGGECGTVTITNSTISCNSAAQIGEGGGGGIYGGTILVNDSMISGNSVSSCPYVNENGNFGGSSVGGGIMGEVVTVIDSKITGNSAYFYKDEYVSTGEEHHFCRGGGIAGNSVTVIDSVVSYNSAFLDGDEDSYGGGISGGTIKVVNSTIAGNLAESGGGISGTLTANNSIIAINEGGNVAGSITANGSIIDVDPGFVQNPSVTVWDDGMGGTYCSYIEGDLHLTQNSFAVNAGNNTLAVDLHGNPLTADCEGNTRIYDSVVDAGAYEYQGVPTGTHILAVDTISDDVNYNDGLLTLREAIYYAANLSSIDTITFDGSLNGQVIVLSGQELLIDGDITIDASGLADGITINGDGKSRVFNIDDATVELISLTIMSGTADDFGGGIYNSGVLTVTNSAIQNSSVNWNTISQGGGIYNSGTLILNNSVVSSNQADSGCGIYSSGTLTVTDSTISSNIGGVGGGIYSDGTVLVENSTISDNFVGYGSGIYGGIVTVIGSTITNNYADLYGGGIYGDTVTITDSVISGNVARIAGGGIFFTDTLTVTSSSVGGNSADFGGGIADSDGSYYEGASGSMITITDSTISGNRAHFGYGGGIFSCGTLIIMNSAIRDNSAGISYYYSGGENDGHYESARSTGVGGGICGNIITVMHSSIIGNSAYGYSGYSGDESFYSYGGGISGSMIAVINSTVTCNAVYFYGEGEGYSYGGGISGGTVKVVSSTIAGNYSDSGGGVYSNGTLTADNSIIALNNGGEVEGNVISNGSIIDVYPWFVRNPTATFVNDSMGGMYCYDEGDLRLTQYSTAINAGDNARSIDLDGNALAVDFDGNPRIYDGIVDAGAYEYEGQAADALTFVVTTASDTTACDNMITLREAISYASHLPKIESITFDASLNGEEIILDGEEIFINNNITIDASGLTDGITINGDGKSRVFNIGNAAVELINLTITGGMSSDGDVYGGGIYNSSGKLKITESSIVGNSAILNFGGGIFNESGALILTNSAVSNNIAGGGGGISNGGTVTLINSTVSDNFSGNGGGICGGEIAITGSYIHGNYADLCGGGIYGEAITIADSTICENVARISGGGIYIGSYSGTLMIMNSTIEGNSADFGGGIGSDCSFTGCYEGNDVTMAILDSIISNNHADFGGGICSEGSLTISNSIITDGMVIDQNGDGIPDTVINPETGEMLSVIDLSDTAIVVSNPSPENHNDPEATVTVPKTDGWIYVSIPDPFEGTRELLSITTSNGKTINPNDWWIDESGNICVLDDPDVVYELDYENPAAVIGRHIFYNNSSFDTVSDDNAIATDKQALLTGSKATFANYTSYMRGINGIMIDISGLSGTVTAADFSFRIGNSDTTSSWENASSPASINVRAGEGALNSDRVVITWADGIIVNTWLEVTVLANANTGLASNDVFYFGNAIGETGNSLLNAGVNISDMALARLNQTGFTQASINNLYDFNRDKKVNVTDIGLVRSHQSGFSPLRLINLATNEGIVMTSDVIVLSRQTSNKVATPQQLAKSIWLDSDEEDDEDSLLAILESA